MNRDIVQCFLILAAVISAGCASTATKGSCSISPGMTVPSSIYSSPQKSPKSPSLEVPETVYDFGQVSGKNALAHAFNIKNNGSATLHIKKILPS